MRVIKFFAYFILLACTLFISSCMNESSSLATLDEFAGIAQKGWKTCIGGNAVSSFAKVEGSMRETVNLTLSAVPEGFQNIFFKVGGKIVVLDSEKAKAECENVINDKHVVRDIYGGSKSSIYTCWRMKGGHPVIYVEEDEAKIRHSLVRVFSYYVMQAVIPGAKKSKTTEAYAVSSEKKLNQLSEAFLKDLESLDSTRAARFSSEFSRELLNQYVLAESFDSYYCNSSTRTSMQNKFPATFAAFNKLFLK